MTAPHCTRAQHRTHTRARLGLAALLLVIAAATSACDSARSEGGSQGRPVGSMSPSPSPSASASAAVPSAAGSGAASVVASVGSSTTPLPVDPLPGGRRTCLSGVVEISYPGSDNPLRSVCVHVGTRISVTLHATAGAPWRPVVTGDPQVAGVTTDSVSAGSVSATAVALAPGTAVLSATTRAGSDPSGPMTRHWQLVVTVVR